MLLLIYADMLLQYTIATADIIAVICALCLCVCSMSSEDVIGVLVTNSQGENIASAGTLAGNSSSSAWAHAIYSASLALHSSSQSLNESEQEQPVISVETNAVVYLISHANTFTTCIAKRTATHSSQQQQQQ